MNHQENVPKPGKRKQFILLFDYLELMMIQFQEKLTFRRVVCNTELLLNYDKLRSGLSDSHLFQQSWKTQEVMKLDVANLVQ